VRSIVLDVIRPAAPSQGVMEVAATIFQGARTSPSPPSPTLPHRALPTGSPLPRTSSIVIAVRRGGLDRRLCVHTSTRPAPTRPPGKVTTMISAGKYKAEGIGALSDDARSHMQGRIDGYYSQFVKTVARNRDVRSITCATATGEGRVLSAQAALTPAWSTAS
jgi:hypothetical protein